MIDQEVLAWATAIYEAVKTPAWFALQKLGFRLARQFHEDSLWLLRQPHDRLTYPYCVYWYVNAMFDRERSDGRRADWFLWIEDDIVPQDDLYEKLRAAADPEDRPYVSALAYTRTPPYGPGIASVSKLGNVNTRTQWEDVPQSGTHPTDSVGMCAALFHRSLFDRIPEPWFGVMPPNKRGGIGPDAFWCSRLIENGIQPYVCCDAEVEHIGPPVLINRNSARRWRASRDIV
uniref:Glycosyltransferase n=1 Tax=viral metagenome TaxID=1070528 RepID=A0A6M3IRL1_9ZZZZ